MSRLLVLADSEDGGAAAVVGSLEVRLDARAVLWLTPQQLGLARRWVHTVGADGEVRTEFETTNGIRVAHGSFGAVLNRIGFVAPVRFANGSTKDRDYATMELTALVWSWLAGLRVPVLNPPGRGRSAHRWLAEARRAGLPIASVAVTSSRRPAATPPSHGVEEVLVTGERAHGPLARRWGDACVRLAAAAGCPFLVCRFAEVAGRAVLVAVDQLPTMDDPASVAATGDYLAGLLTAGAGT